MKFKGGVLKGTHQGAGVGGIGQLLLQLQQQRRCWRVCCRVCCRRCCRRWIALGLGRDRQKKQIQLLLPCQKGLAGTLQQLLKFSAEAAEAGLQPRGLQ